MPNFSLSNFLPPLLFEKSSPSFPFLFLPFPFFSFDFLFDSSISSLLSLSSFSSPLFFSFLFFSVSSPKPIATAVPVPLPPIPLPIPIAFPPEPACPPEALIFMLLITLESASAPFRPRELCAGAATSFNSALFLLFPLLIIIVDELALALATAEAPPILFPFLSLFNVVPADNARD